jgi:hypothetical protein
VVVTPVLALGLDPLFLVAVGSLCTEVLTSHHHLRCQDREVWIADRARAHPAPFRYVLLQMLYLISSSNSSSNSNEDSSNIVNKVIVTMAVIVLVTTMLIAMKAHNCCAFTVEYQELQCSTVTLIYYPYIL